MLENLKMIMLETTHLDIALMVGVLLLFSGFMVGCTSVTAVNYFEIQENAKSPVVNGSTGVQAAMTPTKDAQYLTVGQDITSIKEIDTAAALQQLDDVKNATTAQDTPSVIGDGRSTSDQKTDSAIQDDDKVDVKPDINVEVKALP